MSAADAKPKPGLRERRNLRTRRAIVRAAAELTLEESFAAATIPRIAERAEVAPRTVSGWFPIKDEILFEGREEHLEIAARHFEDGEGDTLGRLRSWLAEELERRRNNDLDLEFERLRSRAIEHDPELRARALEHMGAIHGLIAASVARDKGGLAHEPGPQLFAGATVSMLRILQAAGLEPLSEEEIEARLEQGFAFLGAGMRTLAASSHAG